MLNSSESAPTGEKDYSNFKLSAKMFAEGISAEQQTLNNPNWFGTADAVARNWRRRITDQIKPLGSMAKGTDYELQIKGYAEVAEQRAEQLIRTLEQCKEQNSPLYSQEDVIKTYGALLQDISTKADNIKRLVDALK